MDEIVGIYSIECVINGKKYIGKSNNVQKRSDDHFNKLRKNRHDNLHLQDAFNKYGEEYFIFYTLEKCSLELLNEKENYWIEKYKTLDRNFGYNMIPGGTNPPILKGIPKSENQKKKMSIAAKGKKKSRESVEKSANTQRGKKLSQQTKNKMSEVHKNISDETRIKMSISGKGRKKSEDHKRKIGEGNKGKIVVITNETKNKISNSLKGKPKSEETKARMGVAQRKRFGTDLKENKG